MTEDWTKNGGPAFPVALGSQPGQYACSSGMSVRDYFAAKALPSLLAEFPQLAPEQWAKSIIAATRLSYDIADAMLEARK